MAAKSKNTITCNLCAKVECRHGYPEGIPAYCMATKFNQIINQTKKEYSNTESVEIYKAASRVTTKGYGKWPRVQESIEFAKELGLNKIGLASCISLKNELEIIADLFIGAGFETIASACQIGRVSPEDRGVKIESKDPRSAYCNPIAQAMIMNSEGTQLNFMLGLCLGHDILFTRYSKAPVSTLIVKDRVTGHNPAAALYTTTHRRSLYKQYCNKEVE